MIAGIDEVGRGSVIGPLVVAIVVSRPDKIKILKMLRVKDSKKLSRKKREEIYELLVRYGFVTEAIEIQPRVIDRYVRRSGGPGINSLEAEAFASLIMKTSPDIVYIDSPTKIAEEFGQLIRKMLGGYKCRLICEHGADASRPIVSAASIVAKVMRDNAIKRIKTMLGDLGSGYPSDKKTIDALRELLRSERGSSRFIRMSWRTIDALQPSLNDYSEK